MRDKILLWTSDGLKKVDKNKVLEVLFIQLFRYSCCPPLTKEELKAVNSVKVNLTNITCIQIYNDNVVRLHLYNNSSIFITNIEKANNIRLEIKHIFFLMNNK